MQRDVTQEVNTKITALLFRTIEPEDVVIMTAISTGEGTHVLHHTQNWYVDFVEHLHTSDRIAQSQVLRSGDYDGA